MTERLIIRTHFINRFTVCCHPERSRRVHGAGLEEYRLRQAQRLFKF